jgi:NADPH:quinone reductase
VSGPDPMRASAFLEFGAPEILRTLNLPQPMAAADGVVVRVVAAPVNPTDTMMRSGQQAAIMTDLSPPYIAGMEFAGYVHQVGSGIHHLRVGQPVMGAVNPRRASGGAHAEYIAVPAASLAVLADSVDLTFAATVPMNGLTARMVIEALALRPGSTVLVTGAAGAVGGYVVQLAKNAGLTIIADAKETDHALVRQLGVDIAVPRGEAMESSVRQHFPNGVDGLVDCALIGDKVAALVRDGGVAVSLRRSNPIADPRLKACYVSVVEQVNNNAAMTELAEMLRTGVLTPRVSHRLPLAEAEQAHRLVERGGLRGRVVLLMQAPEATALKA